MIKPIGFQLWECNIASSHLVSEKHMKIHLIAIGGAVMHNLAIALHTSGHEVTGSDDEIFEPSFSRLNSHGLLPAKMGWHPERLHQGLDTVILGMHARADNPELLQAQQMGLRVLSFPEFVFSQSASATRVAICGSHGKTTITSMIMHALKLERKAFDYLVGAQLEGFDTMVQFSEAPIMVIEGDEYFASPLDRRPKFLHYRPQIALISGIAWDHFNVFPTYENYTDQFRLLAEQMDGEGVLLASADDTELTHLLRTWKTAVRVEPYSALPYRIHDGSVIIEWEGADFLVGVFGRHNLTNMSGAMQVCRELGIQPVNFLQHMATFRGAAKRLELLSSSPDKKIYRDFAHAPSKVAATVQAVAEMHPESSFTAVLELHTFSSLNKDFLPQYRGSMQGASTKIVFFTPHTLAMKKLPAISPEEILDFFDNPEIKVFTDTGELFTYLQTTSPSLLLLMSSGNFGNLNIDGLM